MSEVSFFIFCNPSIKLNYIARLQITFFKPFGQINPKMIRYYFDELGVYANAYLRFEDRDIVQRVEYVSRGKLIRKDYFTYGRLFSEYYSPVNNEAHLYMRRFYNENGTEALVEIIDGETNVYKIGNRTIFSKQRFISTDNSFPRYCGLRITVYFSIMSVLSSFFSRSLTAERDIFTFLLISEMETREFSCSNSRILTSVTSILSPPDGTLA